VFHTSFPPEPLLLLVVAAAPALDVPVTELPLEAEPPAALVAFPPLPPLPLLDPPVPPPPPAAEPVVTATAVNVSNPCPNCQVIVGYNGLVMLPPLFEISSVPFAGMFPSA